MAIHTPAKQRVAGSPKVSKSTRLPAPIRGVDSRNVLSEGDPLVCIYCYNLTPSEYGMQVRNGYREWCIDLNNGGLNNEVGTIVPFGGVDDDPIDDRLFAVTNEGIWDVTNENTPILKIDFLIEGNGDTSSNAGYGVYTQFTTDADEQLLYYADSRNGLFKYSEATDDWIQENTITGVDPTKVVFVTTHKKQLWFIEKDSSIAWYLPAAFISGEATKFTFGAKFKHGGNLAGLFSWTVDGGEGLDDYLVAISRAGDVLPYKGTDPQGTDTWSSQGQYFIGAVPKGNRFATEHGGDLMILSAYGLIAMSDLIEGVDGKDAGEFTQTLQISSILRNQMKDTRDLEGWDVRLIPSQGNLLISSPQQKNGTFRQYARNTTSEGWGFWREIPINTFDEWAGNVYFGTKEGKVYIMDVFLDNVKITSPPEEINGTPINFSILSTYQTIGEPTLFKRGKYIRADFVATVAPVVTLKFRYDFDIEEILNESGSQINKAAQWDIDRWDAAIWNTTTPFGNNQLTGGWGMGRYIAIAMRGNSNTQTTFIGWDVIWDSGAPL